MRPDRTRISVVVPSYGRPLALTRCLLSLQQQDRLPDEVLVAFRDDDRDTGALTEAWRSDAFATVSINVGTANASAARNQCVARATGDIIAFLDDDAVAHRSWLASIERALAADPRIGGVGGPDWIDGVEVPAEQRPRQTGVVQWWGRRVGNHHRGATEARNVQWLKGANMSFRRAAIAGITFGDGLRGRAAQFAEDVALSLQVHRAGWLLRYDPEVAVDHFPGAMLAGNDHRQLRDDASLSDAAFNDGVAMLGYLPPLRRMAFLVWSWTVGTRMLPGIVAACSLQARGDRRVAHRWSLVARARWQAWRSMSGSSTRAATPAQVAPPSPPALGSGSGRSLRICLVTHVVDPADGQGRVNYELTRWLVQQGHHVTLVASEVYASLRDLPGVRWIPIAVPAAPEPVRWLIFAWRVRRVLGAHPERDFDVVHLNGAIAPVPASVNTSHFVHAAWAPVFRQIGGVTLRDWYQRGVTQVCTWLERRAYRSAASVVAVSESVQHALRTDVGMQRNNVAVIHTGVDSAEFRPRLDGDRSILRAACEIPPNALVALFVGDARSPRKNLDLALHTVALLPESVHLAIAGNATDTHYPALARELGLSGRVHFLGMRSDVAALYREADVVFCASHYEPASLVLLEAMASGAVVIATPDVGNAVFIVDGENGFLLRSCADVDRAVEVVQLLAGDAARRAAIGLAARATAAALTWERMAVRYESLYRALDDAAVARRAAA